MQTRWSRLSSDGLQFGLSRRAGGSLNDELWREAQQALRLGDQLERRIGHDEWELAPNPADRDRDE